MHPVEMLTGVMRHRAGIWVELVPIVVDGHAGIILGAPAQIET